MKKHLLITIPLLFVLFGATSCLKDEGNYDYADMSGFYVDTLGIKTRHTVKQFSVFELTPKLEYPGDKSKLKYKWELYKSEMISIGGSSYGTGFSHNYTRDDYPDYTLAETEKLSVAITAVPNEYYLVFTAMDPETGVKAMMDYRLKVEGVIGSGLAVLYKGTAGIDIDVVASPLFNRLLTDSSYVRKAYSTANASRPFAGEPRELVAACGYGYDNIYLASTEDAVRLSSIDMRVKDEFEELFAGKVPQKKELSNIVVYKWKNHFFVNDGVAYKLSSGTNLPPLIMRKDDYRAVAVQMAPGWDAIWYDGLKYRFLYSTRYSAEITSVPNGSGEFDFDNIGKELIHMSKGFYENQSWAYYCFFKNLQDDGKRYLYLFYVEQNQQTWTNEFKAVCAMDVTACTGISDAVSFATGERGLVMFYATDAAVYRMTCNVSGGTSNAESVWTPGNGEKITRIKLFKHDGLNFNDVILDKYLLVATYNESTGKGKIYVIESDIASGVLKGEKAVYEFDGKIADFDFMAQ